MDFEYDVMDSVDVFCNTKIEDIIDKAAEVGTPPIEAIENLTKIGKQSKGRSKRNNTKKSKTKDKQEIQPEESVEPETGDGTDEAPVNNEINVTPQVSSSSTSQRGKARRRYLSELANTLAIVDNFDLTEKTLQEGNAGTSTRSRRNRQQNTQQQNIQQRQRNSNVICIGSDDDDAGVVYEPIKINNPDSQLNTSYSNLDLENPEYSIKIEWLNKIEAFPLRKYQKFYDIFEILSKRENADIKDIILNNRSKIITPNDTPDSINYLCLDIISGRVVKNSTLAVHHSTNKDNNLILVKLQSNGWKGHIQISIKKTDTFKILYIKCSEELKIPFEKFTLHFDGDTLAINDTPNDLNLEDGEIIDCIIKK